MTQKITVYKTADGSEFLKKAEADKWELILKLVTEKVPYLIMQKAVISFLEDNKATLKKLL